MGLGNLAIIWNSELVENMFQKLDLFLSLGEGKETPALLGPMHRNCERFH
jgi:hypothetical protein